MVITSQPPQPNDSLTSEKPISRTNKAKTALSPLSHPEAWQQSRAILKAVRQPNDTPETLLARLPSTQAYQNAHPKAQHMLVMELEFIKGTDKPF